METVLGNNLYPPIMLTYAPAFLRTESCFISFTLSEYDNVKDIKNVQIIVVDQNTNQSILNRDKYSSEIKIMPLTPVTDKRDTYYIELTKDDFKNRSLELNKFYKVQLRFTHKNAPEIPSNGKIANWLSENRPYFSEWSKVCLIHPIGIPQFKINNFSETENTTLQSLTLETSGYMFFSEEDKNEQEYIKNYKLYIKYVDSMQELSSSPILIPDTKDKREIFYKFKIILPQKQNFYLYLEYETINGYKGIKRYSFQTPSQELIPFNCNVSVCENKVKGCLDLHINLSQLKNVSGDLIIKRASQKTLFQEWNDVHIIKDLPQQINFDYIWSDISVESGIWYQYAIQNKKNSEFSQLIKTNPKMVLLDDMFLIDKDYQLRIQFNPQINSLQYRIPENILETLGSRFPYIQRNGYTNYRKFTISGLISKCEDADNLFISDSDLYGNNAIAELYKNYNQEHNIYDYNDFIKERHFREKVIAFLTDGKFKLFKSTPEGNVLVRLTDISLTPTIELGRMLYTFSATANEIAECNIDNFNKLDIQEVVHSIEYQYVLRVKDVNSETDTVIVSPLSLNNSLNTLVLEKDIRVIPQEVD